jgi:alcohol dehydrogenase (cytochrome c)
MYNGDYSGRRFSPLTKIDTSTVSSMTLAWVYRPNPGNAPAGGGGQTVVHDQRHSRSSPTECCIRRSPITSGRWTRAAAASCGTRRGHRRAAGTSANRGVAVLGRTVYVETPDCNLVALDTRDGREKWRTEICDLEQFYYASQRH